MKGFLKGLIFKNDTLLLHIKVTFHKKFYGIQINRGMK